MLCLAFGMVLLLDLFLGQTLAEVPVFANGVLRGLY
jgi:hypothetical protein